MTVKLTQDERNRIGRETRAQVRRDGYRDLTDTAVLDAAVGYIASAIDELGRFDDVAYVVISDYAWSFARFLFPHAARW